MIAADSYFLDTNVLVYADDSRDSAKRQRSESLILDGIDRSSARISAQVLGEYFVTVTKKIATPLSPDLARRRVELFSTMPVLPIDARLVSTALSAMRRYDIAYWDALIVCAAAAMECSVLYSEDLNPGQDYLGVRVVNPYEDGLKA
jgi:predicted nucleic acid-binding protein